MKAHRLLLLAALGFITACGELDLGGPGDGQSVEFSSGYAFVRDGEIYVADKSDYQAAKRLTSSGSNSAPAISADGRVIVFIHTDSQGVTSLRKVSPAGGDESELVSGADDRQVADPAVSADGNLVAFVAQEAGTSGLSVVDIDGSNERAFLSNRYDSSPSFYPDGNRVLVLTGPSSFSRDELMEVDLSGGQRSSRGSGFGTLGSRAAISPDGSAIAFEMRADGRTRIFAVDEAGGQPRQISATGGDDTYPTWIGNDRLGFTSNAGSGSNVYEIDLAVGTDGSASLAVPSASQCSFGGSP
jgi:Tol biopolymer transport system component